MTVDANVFYLAFLALGLLALVLYCVHKVQSILHPPLPPAIVLPDEVIAKLKAQPPEWLSLPVSPPVPTRRASMSYVYLIRDGTGHTKIGRTHNLQRRLKSLHTTSATRLEVVHVIQTPDASHLEKRLHHRFKAKRVNREWFNLSEEDIQSIKDSPN